METFQSLKAGLSSAVGVTGLSSNKASVGGTHYLTKQPKPLLTSETENQFFISNEKFMLRLLPTDLNSVPQEYNSNSSIHLQAVKF